MLEPGWTWSGRTADLCLAGHAAEPDCATEAANAGLGHVPGFRFPEIRLLSQHFRRLTLVVHSQLSTRLLERERPAIVIDEIAERNLARVPPVKDGGVGSR